MGLLLRISLRPSGYEIPTAINFAIPPAHPATGYEPHELIGTASLLLVHPDEFSEVKELHYTTISQDQAAVLAYLRMKHKDPYKGYILCGIVSFIRARSPQSVSDLDAVDPPIVTHCVSECACWKCIICRPRAQGYA